MATTRSREEASISGTVFIDTNGDGRKDPDESIVPGIKVELLKDGSVIATQFSDQNGDYSFTGLQEGEYEIAYEDQSESTEEKLEIKEAKPENKKNIKVSIKDPKKKLKT